VAHIEHFALFADDLDALRAFYEEAFGMTVIVDNGKAPVRGFFLSDGAGGVLEIIERPGGVPAESTRYTCHAAFFVEDFDAARDALAKRGARFETDTVVDNPSMRTVFFDDPEGNRLQIVWRPRPLGS
jgi:glyoxylase I family protein